MGDYRTDREPGGKTIVRNAVDVRDGDELILDRWVLLVQEKSLNEYDQVVLMIVLDPNTPLVTRTRPSERATPFEGVAPAPHDTSEVPMTTVDVSAEIAKQIAEYTPTEELVMEVLTARRRTGEHFWTFTSRPSIVRTIRALEARGLVFLMHGQVEKTVRAGLTEKGWKEWADEDYVSPIERDCECRLDMKELG